MEKSLKDLNNKEIKAVRELINKLSSEDLEKAAGGISPRAKNILLVTGLLAVTGITSAVLASKYKSGNNIGGPPSRIDRLINSETDVCEWPDEGVCDVPDEGICEWPDEGICEVPKAEEKSSTLVHQNDFEQMIRKYNVSETLVKAVGGKENVFKKSTYYDGEKLKSAFDLYNGRIYHKDTQYEWGGWKCISAERGRGVPEKELR